MRLPRRSRNPAVADGRSTEPPDGLSGKQSPGTQAGPAWSSSPQLVVVASVIAGLVGAIAGASPTGTPGWDPMLGFAFAALFTLAASRAPAWVVVIAATAAMAFSSTSSWFVVAAAALLVAIASEALRSPQPWLKTVAGLLCAQTLLRLPAVGFFGLPSLVAATSFVFVALFAYLRAGPTARKHTRRALLALIMISGLFGAVGTAVVYSARGDVQQGADHARIGMTAARGGDPEQVVASLDSASTSFAQASDTVSGLLTQPLRLLPIAAQHRQAIVAVTAQGHAITEQASRMVNDADIASVRLVAGQVDLAALAAMEDDLQETSLRIMTAVDELSDARSSWLLPPVISRIDEVIGELDEVVPETQLAAKAAAVVPDMLGATEPQRYFVAFGNPGESREFGGFVGSWALVEFDAGSVRQVDAGRIAELYELARQQPPLSDDEYPSWFVERSQPQQWPQNLTSAPSIEVVASAARHLFDGIEGASIDGLIYIDSIAIEAVLKLTGPIRISGVDGRINANNVVAFLHEGQYRLDNRQEIKSQAGEIFSQAFERLLEREVPGPERLGQLFGPAARQGRLQVATFDEEQNEFLQELHLQREFGWPASTSDSLAIVQTAGVASKLDLYVHRNVTYDVQVDATGALTGTVSVDVALDVPNNAPAYTLGRDDPGLALVRLSLYSPHQVTGVELDGRTVERSFTNELGYGRHEVTVELRPGDRSRLAISVEGSVDPTRPYALSVWQQPLVNPDVMRVNAVLGDTEPMSIEFPLIENVTVAVVNGALQVDVS